MDDLKFSILMPTYEGSKIIRETLGSILSQSFKNFEIIINDDASVDNIEQIIVNLNDKRIKFYKNEKRLGYPRNLQTAMNKATGDIIYLMGQDDILGKDALLNTYRSFKISDNIGAVTRPYYWFDKEITTPVRAKKQLNPYKDEIVTINDNPERVVMVFRTLDQLSGLAFKAKYMDMPFHEDVFPCHVYPFASIFKKYPVVFLKDYNIAVRISSSQTRSVSSIYEKSPMESWIDLFRNIFPEEKNKKIRNYCIKNFVSTNYIGLVQIRNFSKYKNLLREIIYLIKYRWYNIFNPTFWILSLGCMIIPPCLLVKMVDWYKNNINSTLQKKINFEYNLN